MDKLLNVEIMPYSPGEKLKINYANDNDPLLPRHKVVAACLDDYTGEAIEKLFQKFLLETNQTELDFYLWFDARQDRKETEKFNRKFRGL